MRIAQKEARRVNGVRRLRREKPIAGVGVLGEGAAIPLISLVSGLQVSRQLIPWKQLQKSLDLVAIGVAPTPWGNVSTVARGGVQNPPDPPPVNSHAAEDLCKQGKEYLISLTSTFYAFFLDEIWKLLTYRTRSYH